MGRFFDYLRPIQFRGKYRVLSPIAPESGHCTASVFGYAMDLDLSHWDDRLVYLGCYEPLNTWRFRRILRPGMTVVDVGASLGYFTLLASRLTGAGGRVFAVEPTPRHFGLLTRTLERNGLSQVRPCPFALGHETAAKRIAHSTLHEGRNRTASLVPTTGGDSVLVRTLDDCLHEWGVEKVDLLKVDVDGYESRVIQGATAALAAGRVRSIVIEFEDYWLKESGTSAGALDALIRSLGFKEDRTRERAASFLLGPGRDRLYIRR